MSPARLVEDRLRAIEATSRSVIIAKQVQTKHKNDDHKLIHITDKVKRYDCVTNSESKRFT
jgi:hypothetical protein